MKNFSRVLLILAAIAAGSFALWTFLPPEKINAAPPVFADRVKETTTTTGTGTLTLAGTSTGFQAFSKVGNGAQVFYVIDDGGANWEVGLGTYTLSGTTLSRDTVLDSSNSGALVSFGAGTKTVRLDAPAYAFANPDVLNNQKVFNVKAYGAKGDVQQITNGSITVSTAVLTSSSNPFSPADVGKKISVQGAGNQGNSAGVANWLITTILSYQSAGQVTLNANATATVSGTALTTWGTDDAAAINAATLAASTASGSFPATGGGSKVCFPAGTYFVGTAINVYSRIHIIGEGSDTTCIMLAPGATNDIFLGNNFATLTGGNTSGGIFGWSIENLKIDGFARHGGFVYTTNSTTAITSTATSITVDSTSAFPSSGTLILAGDASAPGEVVSYTSKDATHFLGVTRAQENTVAIAASTGISICLRSTGGVFGSGYGIRVYGYGYHVSDISIDACYQDGYYSEWGTSANQPNPDGLKAYLENINIHSCIGNGMWWLGPHDSIFTAGEIYTNGLTGVRLGGGASGIGMVNGTQLVAVHCSGLQVYGFSCEAFCELIGCINDNAVNASLNIGANYCQILGFRANSDASSFVKGIILSGSPQFCTIDASCVDCLGGSIDFTNDGGNNFFRLQIRQQQGGNVFIGTPAASSNTQITELPQNLNDLSGTPQQMSAPVFMRSLQNSPTILTLQSPFTQTSNFLQAQYSNGVVRFCLDKNFNVGINQASPTAGLHQVGGSQKLVALGNPSAPTVTPFPTGGATTYTYFVVAEDAAGNKTLASASAQTTTGPATLNSTNWVRSTWTAVTGAVKYYVLKTNTATLLGTISPNTGGAVTQVAVTAGGSGYTGGAPAVGFSGPAQNKPQATSTVAANAVTAINITTGQMGSGFTSVPNVVIGGPGNGATATAVMGASNFSSINNGGSGYAVNDTITLTGGTFTTATVLKVTSVSGGVVTAVSVKTPGSYSVLPTNPVSQGSTSGAGTGFTVSVSWGISSVTVTAGGTGYSSAPSIGFNGGGALPTATAITASNAVSGISLSSGASGYIGTPTVILQGLSAGSGATATASLVTLSMDDVGQSTSGFTNPLRNATADSTIGGMVSATDVLDAPYVSTDKEMLRHYEVVTSAAATLQLVTGIARTVTSAVAATNQKNARGEWLRISATANNADSSLVAATFTETQLQASPVFNTRVEIPTAKVNMRVFIGLFSATAVMTADTQNTIHSAFFRFSTGASDTNWQCATSNASATTVIDSGVAVAVDTIYKLRIDCSDNTRIKFFINDSLVAVGTATLPTASTGLAPGHFLRSLSASGQKDLDTAFTEIKQ